MFKKRHTYRERQTRRKWIGGIIWLNIALGQVLGSFVSLWSRSCTGSSHWASTMKMYCLAPSLIDLHLKTLWRWSAFLYGFSSALLCCRWWGEETKCRLRAESTVHLSCDHSSGIWQISSKVQWWSIKAASGYYLSTSPLWSSVLCSS